MQTYATIPGSTLDFSTQLFKELYWKCYSPNSLVAVAHDRVQLVADINEEDILEITLLGWVRKHTALMSALGSKGSRSLLVQCQAMQKQNPNHHAPQVKKDNDVIPLNKQTGGAGYPCIGFQTLERICQENLWLLSYFSLVWKIFLEELWLESKLNALKLRWYMNDWLPYDLNFGLVLNPFKHLALSHVHLR